MNFIEIRCMRTLLLLVVFGILPHVSAAQSSPQIQFKFPQSALEQGEIYSISFTLIPGQANGICRFEAELPEGALVNEQNSDGALFSFSHNRLELQWLSLPEKDSLHVEFALFLSNFKEKTLTIASSFRYQDEQGDHLQQFDQIAIPVKLNASNTSSPAVQSVQRLEVSDAGERDASGVTFSIQLGAFKQAIQAQVLAQQFGIPVKGIHTFQHQGMVKYAYGHYSSIQEAKKEMQLHPAMLGKTFIVAFNQGQRIELDDAIELSEH